MLARIFAVTAAGALCLAGLASIGIFLFGTFGETETRLWPLRWPWLGTA